MLYVGLVTGVVVENLAAHVTGINAFHVFVATLILIPPAIAGARLLFVAAHWDQYRRRPQRIWDREDGGMEVYGGMPIMLLLSCPLLRALGVGFGAFWDVASLTIMTGMIVTRVGCLLNGCCAGRPSRGRLGVFLPNLRGVCQKRIPVQGFEAGWAAVVLAVATALLGRLPFPGALFLVVIALYSAGRLGLQWLREPEEGAGNIVVGHAASVVTVVVSIAILAAEWPK
jgi:phosphatidylglycerol---prolipoprotein diacylglyceryl transferase